jgi:hypothetical protein
MLSKWLHATKPIWRCVPSQNGLADRLHDRALSARRQTNPATDYAPGAAFDAQRVVYARLCAIRRRRRLRA